MQKIALLIWVNLPFQGNNCVQYVWLACLILDDSSAELAVLLLSDKSSLFGSFLSSGGLVGDIHT